MRPGAALVVVSIFTVACAGTSSEEPAPSPPGQVDSAPTKTVLRYEKLDQTLNLVVASQRPLEVAREHQCRVVDDLVQVTVVSTEAAVEGLASWLEEHHARNVLTAGDSISAYVAVALLPDLDAHPAVRRVHRPQYGQPLARDEAK